jgi:hypothetical protein
MTSQSIAEIATAHSDNSFGALQIVLSHGVDLARAIPAGEVSVDDHMLIRAYCEQILSATFERLERP